MNFEVRIFEIVRRYGSRQVRAWWFDGPGELERVMTRREWVQVYGTFVGYRAYVHELESERLISSLPRLPDWAMPPKVLARELSSLHERERLAA